MSGSKKWFLLVNPTSGGGRGKKHWPKIKQQLHQKTIDFDFKFSEYPKHGLELIEQAVNDGFRQFIAVGGDGTLHEMVNAIMLQKAVDPDQFCIGLIPVGTGNDWARQFDIPRDYNAAIERIQKHKVIPLDIGVIELDEKPDETIYFNNLAGIGFDGYVVDKIHRFKHWGALAYLAGALFGLLSYSGFKASVSWNESAYSGDIFMLIIGLGTYSGGGMQLTRSPDPADGLFDISLLPGLSKWKVLELLPSLFNGRVTEKKMVNWGLSTSLTIRVNNSEKVCVQADGEIVGKGSFAVRIIPEALKFCV